MFATHVFDYDYKVFSNLKMLCVLVSRIPSSLERVDKPFIYDPTIIDIIGIVATADTDRAKGVGVWCIFVKSVINWPGSCKANN